MSITRRTALATASLLASARPAQAAEGDIVVGQVGPFTGIPVPDALQLNQGFKAAFAQINGKGGINGRQISLFEVDDTYTADGFVKAFGEAMKRKPVALLSPVGSVALKRMLDDKMLDHADTIVLNAIPGAEVFRNPGHPKLFHVRAGDRQQIEKIVLHASTLGITRMAVLNQNIPVGTSGLAAAQESAKKVGTLALVAFEASTEQPTIAAAAAKVRAAEPQAVFAVGAPRFVADSIAELRKAGVGQFIFGLGYVPAPMLAKIAGPGARGVGLTQTYPNPGGISLPVQREFRAAMAVTEPSLNVFTSFHLEGYITARVFAEAARRAKEVTPDGIAKALHSVGEIDLGGYRVDFSKGNTGSRFVDIGVINIEGRLIY